MEEEAAKLFEQAELGLRALGFEVVNPMNLPHDHDKRWGSYMIECLTALMTCDGVFMLLDWEKSRGARIEHIFAKAHGLEIMEEGE